jgi:hypothetical protein
LVALVSKKLKRQIDALDLAKPSFRFGSAAAHDQVCLDLIQALEHSVVYVGNGAAEAGIWFRTGGRSCRFDLAPVDYVGIRSYSVCCLDVVRISAVAT